MKSNLICKNTQNHGTKKNNKKNYKLFFFLCQGRGWQQFLSLFWRKIIQQMKNRGHGIYFFLHEKEKKIFIKREKKVQLFKKHLY